MTPKDTEPKLLARLQQYMNWEFPDVQAGFRQGKGTRDQIANIHWIIKNMSLSHILLFATPMDCSLPGFSVHGIIQARILEWVVAPFSRGCSLLQVIFPTPEIEPRSPALPADSLPSESKKKSIENIGESPKKPASLTALKPLTVWITTNCGKFLRRWEYQTT